MALTISVEDIISTTNNPLLQAKPHWTRVRLGDVATVLNGYAFKAKLFNRTEGTPIIRIRDVGSDDSQTLYSGEFESKYVVQPGELLIGMDGDFNCARWRGKPSLLNQRVCKVSISTDAYEDRFLDFVLPGYLKAINDATSSITVKHLSSRTIQEIPLPCPPIDEQREIVAELDKQFSRLDEAVANLQRVKANLKRYKASVLKDAVKGLANSSTQINPAGSVMIGMIGQGKTRGQAAILDIEAANNQNCAAIWVSHTAIPTEYVFFWLMSRYTETRCEGSGNNQQALNKRLVEQIPLPLPPLAEQQRIVAEVDRRLSLVRSVETEVDTNLKRTQSFRQATLRRAFFCR